MSRWWLKHLAASPFWHSRLLILGSETVSANIHLCILSLSVSVSFSCSVCSSFKKPHLFKRNKIKRNKYNNKHYKTLYWSLQNLHRNPRLLRCDLIQKDKLKTLYRLSSPFFLSILAIICSLKLNKRVGRNSIYETAGFSWFKVIENVTFPKGWLSIQQQGFWKQTCTAWKGPLKIPCLM